MNKRILRSANFRQCPLLTNARRTFFGRFDMHDFAKLNHPSFRKGQKRGFFNFLSLTLLFFFFFWNLFICQPYVGIKYTLPPLYLPGFSAESTLGREKEYREWAPREETMTREINNGPPSLSSPHCENCARPANGSFFLLSFPSTTTGYYVLLGNCPSRQKKETLPFFSACLS